MGLVTMLPVGEDIGASHMKDLFVGLEERVDKLLDGKSLFLLGGGGGQHLNLLGNIYYFVNGEHPIAGPSAQNYDHTPFTEAFLSGVTEISRDEETGLMKVTAPPAEYVTAAGIYGQGSTFGELSLEAHRRENFWVWEAWQIQQVVHRIYQYGTAEFVYEGEGFEEVTIPAEWNKFNFIRIHNLNRYEMTVEFEVNGEVVFSVTVPAWGCQTLRRTGVGSGYELNGKYFWWHKRGDPRMYHMMEVGAGFGEQQPNGPERKTVWQGMSGNNVMNPSLVYSWIKQFDAGGVIEGVANAGVSWVRNRRAGYYDLAEDYSRETDGAHGVIALPAKVFGDAAVGTTLLGDLLHHAGEIRVLERDAGEANYRVRSVSFNGYGDFYNEMLDQDVEVETDISTGRWKVRVTGGTLENLMVGMGTNLLDRATVSSGSWYLLDSHGPAVTDVRWRAEGGVTTFSVVRTLGGTTEFIYKDIDGSDVTVSLPWSGVYFESMGSVYAAWNIWEETVDSVKSLNHFGFSDLAESNQDSELGTFENREVRLTIFGLKVFVDQVIPLTGTSYEGAGSRVTYDLTDAGGVNGAMGLDGGKVLGFTKLAGSLVGDGAISLERMISIGGYGWPAEGTTGPSFVGPKRDRAYSDMKFRRVADLFLAWGHPNFIDEVQGAHGSDFDLEVIGENYEELVGVKKLTEIRQTYPSWPYVVPVWDEPDGMYDFAHFNAVGGAGAPVKRNSLNKMPRIHLVREMYNDMACLVNSITGVIPLTYLHASFVLSDGSAARFSPNGSGMGTQELRPYEQYGLVTAGSDLEKLCEEFEIPILTEANFPASYAAYVAEAETKTKWIWNGISEAWESVVHDGPVLFPGAFFMSQAGMGFLEVWPLAAPYRWCKIADVQEAVEALGFIFLYREVSVPHTLRKEVVGSPVPVWNVPSYSPGTTIARDSWWLASGFGETPEWKMKVDYGNLVAYRPGDIFVFGNVGKWPASAELRADVLAFGLRAGSARNQRRLMYQHAGSSRLDWSESVAILNPVSWLGHPVENFAETSEEIGEARAAGGTGYIPLEVKTSSGGRSFYTLHGNGVTILEAVTGKAHEVVWYLGDWVAV